MGNKLNLIIPMAGRGARFADKGYQIPKPLVEISQKPLFFWSIRSIGKYIDIAQLIVVVLQEHIDQFSIDKQVLDLFPTARIVALPEVTAGAVITSQKGCALIENELPIIFNDCDHMFRCPKFYDSFSSNALSNIDGALLTFHSNEPKFSYAELDSNGNLIRTIEKNPISNHAICGAYYFRDRTTFESAAAVYLENCQYNEYYMSGVYNILAQQEKIVNAFDCDYHLSFGTPAEYEEAKKSSEFARLL